MKEQAAERTQHQTEAYINEKRRSNENYLIIIFGILETMK